MRELMQYIYNNREELKYYLDIIPLNPGIYITDYLNGDDERWTRFLLLKSGFVKVAEKYGVVEHFRCVPKKINHGCDRRYHCNVCYLRTMKKLLGGVEYVC